MANVRLLRQRISDHNAAIARANARYESDYNTYAGKVDAWNKIAKETPYLLEATKVSRGILNNPDTYRLTVSSKKISDLPMITGKKISDLPVIIGQPQTVDPDASPVIPVTGSGQYELPDYYAIDNAPKPGQYLSWEKQVTPATYDARGYELTPEQVTWKPVFTEHPEGAGELPVAPGINAPREPSATPQELQALLSNSTDAAGVEMARAKGYSGVSELAAENEDRSRITAFSSAFDNPDNPQALKDRGILAKTLAGKL